MVHKGPFQFKVIGQSQFICISDPESVKYILQDNFNNYIKVWSQLLASAEVNVKKNSSNRNHMARHLRLQGELFRDKLFDLLGDGIFDIDGEPWAFQRKTASHIFTRSQMSTFMTEYDPIFQWTKHSVSPIQAPATCPLTFLYVCLTCSVFKDHAQMCTDRLDQHTLSGKPLDLQVHCADSIETENNHRHTHRALELAC